MVNNDTFCSCMENPSTKHDTYFGNNYKIYIDTQSCLLNLVPNDGDVYRYPNLFDIKGENPNSQAQNYFKSAKSRLTKRFKA